MCGICGKIFLNPERRVEHALLETMARCIHHRGPDQDGLYLRGNCGLAHKRLSIIDLSRGQQPMSNEDGTCWIVFNGEIYNFHELRQDLLARGHVFKTQSDTETIIHLYEEQGERCVESLRGMFAFAIWNEPEQELLLARDRVGKKPLYYALNDDGLVFASEMKALLTEPGVKREINPEAIDDYLTLQYVPAPSTIFKGIQKLAPAQTLCWRVGRVHLRHYWSLSYEPKVEMSEAEACERLRVELDEAVRIRLESEVPLGCLLSGGIDSSAVVAYVRQHISGPLRTFSIGFEEESHNELPHARTIAKLFDTMHEEFIVRPNAIEVLPRLVWHFDEPYADSSALPTYYVAEITRRQVTVALNGDGGDESFAGYMRYRGLNLLDRYQKIPRWLRQGVIGPLGRVATTLLPNFSKAEKLDFLNELSLAPPGRQYAHFLTIFYNRQKTRLYSDMMRRRLHGRDAMQGLIDPWLHAGLRSEIDKKLYTDVTTYLPGDLLVKMDRMAMAHSLEARSPFLDHKLMEFAATLPAEVKLNGGTLKYLLKKAMEPILPREILYRPKQGFGVPLGAWFKTDLQELTRELLLSDKASQRGFFRPESVRKIIDDHVAGRQNHHHRLWALLCFEVWCRTFLDRSDLSAGPITL